MNTKSHSHRPTHSQQPIRISQLEPRPFGPIDAAPNPPVQRAASGFDLSHIPVLSPAVSPSPTLQRQTQPPIIQRDLLQRDLLSQLAALGQKIAALAGHHAQQQRIANLIQQGLAIRPDPTKGIRDRDNLFHNACEWIQQGQCQLVVLSPTHDSATRNPGPANDQRAYFDPQVRYPNLGGDYPLDSAVTASPNLQYDTANTLGGMTPQGLLLEIINPARQTDDELKSLFIHEVQHDADQSWPGQTWATGGSGGQADDYQSEFRAYWLENAEGSAHNTFGSSRRAARNDRTVRYTDPAGTTHTARTNFQNRRQEKIFWHLVDAGYDYVPRLYTTDRTFRRMVNRFAQPVGGNLVNSVRIQTLSQVLTTCNPTMARTDPAIAALLTTAGQLDALDRRFLANSGRSQPFWTQARSSLSRSVYRQFRRAVLNP